MAAWPKQNKKWRLLPKKLNEMEYFISEIDEIRKEKVAKNLRFKDLLTGYQPKTKVDLTIFKDKLQQMLKVEFKSSN